MPPKQMLGASSFSQTGPTTDVPLNAANCGALGDNAIVAGAAGIRQKLLSLTLIAAGNVTLTIGSDTGGTFAALTGPMGLLTSGQLTLPMNEDGWCQSASGKALNFKLGGAIVLNGVAKVQQVQG